MISIEHLHRVWHASRERLPFRTPGSVPPLWDLLVLQLLRPDSSNLPWLFTSNTRWYFLDFAFCLHKNLRYQFRINHHWFFAEISHYGTFDYRETFALRYTILPQTSIPYLIRNASVILNVGINLLRRMPKNKSLLEEKKMVANSGFEPAIV